MNKQINNKIIDYKLQYDYFIPKQIILDSITIHSTNLFLLIFIGLIFLLPVPALLCVQLKNFFANRTTNERFGKG